MSYDYKLCDFFKASCIIEMKKRREKPWLYEPTTGGGSFNTSIFFINRRIAITVEYAIIGDWDHLSFYLTHICADPGKDLRKKISKKARVYLLNRIVKDHFEEAPFDDPDAEWDRYWDRNQFRVEDV